MWVLVILAKRPLLSVPIEADRKLRIIGAWNCKGGPIQNQRFVGPPAIDYFPGFGDLDLISSIRSHCRSKLFLRALAKGAALWEVLILSSFFSYLPRFLPRFCQALESLGFAGIYTPKTLAKIFDPKTFYKNAT